MASCLSNIGTRIGPFSIEFAAGMDDREDEYRLRHAVFVEEYQWLDGQGGNRERDEFDDASCAFVVREADTGEPAACQRFILPDQLAPAVPTNIERFADRLNCDLGRLPRTDWAEVSRTTVAPNYRWGASASSMPAMVAVKYASLAMAIALGRRTLFSLSDRRTARLTRRLGFTVHPASPPVQFHGPRTIFRIEIDEVIGSVPGEMAAPLEALVEAARRAFGAFLR